MSKYRIIQVAPLTHVGAFRVQQLQTVVDISTFDDKQIHNSAYFTEEEMIEKGFPTKKSWKTLGDGVYPNDYGRFNSIYSANAFIERELESTAKATKTKLELDQWNTTHGEHQVIKEYGEDN